MTTLDVQNTTLPMIYLTSWIKAGSHCGINALHVFDALGLNIDVTTAHQAKIPPLQLLQAIEECTSASEGVHFPLALGDIMVFDQMPTAETCIATSPTIRDCFHLVKWAVQMLNPWLRVTLHELDKEAWFTFEQPCYRTDESPLRYVIEIAMVAVHRILFTQLGISCPPLAIHFTHGQPHYHAQYLRHFLIEPKFNQTRNAIFFKRHCLDQALPGARHQLHEQAFSLLMAQLPAPSPTTFSQSVIDRLVGQPTLLCTDLQGVAQSFGVSSRTLQRRLNKEGQGFTEILKQAQQTLATRWLADTNMDISTLSQRLGYKSRRAFTNAFKQWTGTSPSHYRTRLKT